MQTRTKSLTIELLSATGASAKWFGAMLVAAILAIALAAFRVIGAVLALVALVLKSLGEAMHSIGLAILAITPMVLPVLVKLACVAVAVSGIALSFQPVFVAYGGDMAAVFPALAVLLAPVLIALITNTGFGGLAVGGLASFLIGNGLALLPAQARALVVTGVLASIAIYFIKEGSNEQV